MTERFTRIVKVGGSLFDLPDLGERVQSWLDAQPPAVNVLLTGGGNAVDRIRTEAEQRGFTDTEAHWLCVEAMTTSASQLMEAMPGAKIQTHIPFMSFQRPTIFLCTTWLRHLEPLVPGTTLPESWDVTSDSIAARLAICIGADELVLLKSADPPDRDLQRLANIGYIDKFFPKLAGELPPWRMVNFRKA